MNRLNKWIFALVPVFTVGLSHVSHASQFYKWVDEQGATHYTQTPPPQKPVKKVNVSTHVPADSATEIKSLQAQDAADKKATALSEKDQAKSKADAAADADRRSKNQAACQQLQANLDLLQSGRRMRSMDGNGDLTYMTEDDKATMIQQETAQMKQNCPQN